MNNRYKIFKTVDHNSNYSINLFQIFGILKKAYFQNNDVLFLAQDLLGKVIYSNSEGNLTAGIIVETEAYKAPDDRASHAYGNKKTKRTAVMFEEGGLAYVYLCYGIHSMFNIVSGKKGIAHAILIRAVEPLIGIEHMKLRRNNPSNKINLTNGPGKLAQAMDIKVGQSGLPLIKKEKNSIWITENNAISESLDIITGSRVGIAYAQEDAHLPWRFRVKNHPYCSKPDIVSYSRH